MEEMELTCFQIISHAGTAKAKLLEALHLAKQGEVEACNALVQEADEVFIHAHEVHAKLIQQEASGDPVVMSLLLTHAEDQLMGAETTKDFVLEFINLFTNYTLVNK